MNSEIGIAIISVIGTIVTSLFTMWRFRLKAKVRQDEAIAKAESERQQREDQFKEQLREQSEKQQLFMQDFLQKIHEEHREETARREAEIKAERDRKDKEYIQLMQDKDVHFERRAAAETLADVRGQRIDELLQSSMDMVKRLDSARSDFAEAIKKQAMLEGQIESLKHQHGNMHLLTQRLQKDLTTMTERNRVLSDENATLRTEKEAQNKIHTQREKELNDKIVSLEERIKELEDAKARLEIEIAELKRVKSEVSEIVKEAA